MSTTILTLAHGDFQLEGSNFLNSLYQHEYEGNLIGIQLGHDSGVNNRNRMQIFLEVLRKLPKVDTVILTDSRDVIFQDNPSKIKHSDLTCYLEDASQTIGSCAINAANMEACYGLETLQKLKNKPISCAGIVIGSMSGMLWYLRRFVEEVNKGLPGGPWSQPIHNKLLWSGELGLVEVVENEYSDVYTVGHCPSITVSYGRILNRMGEAPIMVHQYDRHL